MEMSENLKRLMKQLGVAINESLTDSETISEAMANIRGAGYDVFLVLEATIGLNRKEDKDSRSRARVERRHLQDGELVLTPKDAEFLKSLKIRIGGNPVQ